MNTTARPARALNAIIDVAEAHDWTVHNRETVLANPTVGLMLNRAGLDMTIGFDQAGRVLGCQVTRGFTVLGAVFQFEIDKQAGVLAWITE